MQLCLKALAARHEPQSFAIVLDDRLPQQLSSPCLLEGQIAASVEKDGYRITLSVQSALTVMCLRCLASYQMAYKRSAVLHAYFDERMATQRMGEEEVIVLDSTTLHLSDILTDDLHLFVPDRHIDHTSCDTMITQWIISPSEHLDS